MDEESEQSKSDEGHHLSSDEANGVENLVRSQENEQETDSMANNRYSIGVQNVIEIR